MLLDCNTILHVFSDKYKNKLKNYLLTNSETVGNPVEVRDTFHMLNDDSNSNIWNQLFFMFVNKLSSSPNNKINDQKLYQNLNNIDIEYKPDEVTYKWSGYDSYKNNRRWETTSDMLFNTNRTPENSNNVVADLIDQLNSTHHVIDPSVVVVKNCDHVCSKCDYNFNDVITFDSSCMKHVISFLSFLADNLNEAQSFQTFVNVIKDNNSDEEISLDVNGAISNLGVLASILNFANHKYSKHADHADDNDDNYSTKHATNFNRGEGINEDYADDANSEDDIEFY